MSSSKAVGRHRAPLQEGRASLEAIERAGAREVEERRTLQQIAKQIEGTQWGSGNSVVKGDGYSESTRMALARYCQVAGADPQRHVEILGGKPWLNDRYYVDLCASDPHYIDYEQENISADQKARSKWGVPKWASHVFLTRIRRFIPIAPLEKIRSGEITEFDQYVTTVEEVNYAGDRPVKTARSGKTYQPDPIGNEEPDKTARTRSHRRCAAKAFAAIRRHSDEIERAERILEAEYEIVQNDRAKGRDSLPSPGGPQAVSTAGGEAEAANPRNARPLPVDGEPEPEPVEAEVVEEDEGQGEGEEAAAEAAEEAFDVDDYRKRLFATLRDAEIKGTARKDWAEANDLPRSTKEWGKADYEKAFELLVGPVRDEVKSLAESLGEDVESLSLKVLEKGYPEFLKDWKALLGMLRAREPVDDGGEL